MPRTDIGVAPDSPVPGVTPRKGCVTASKSTSNEPLVLAVVAKADPTDTGVARAAVDALIIWFELVPPPIAPIDQITRTLPVMLAILTQLGVPAAASDAAIWNTRRVTPPTRWTVAELLL